MGPQVQAVKTGTRNEYLTVLRMLACLMITNSHCKEIYPVSLLALGGGQGNALFFILSGYLLAVPKEEFCIWIKKRLVHILPSWVIMLIVAAIISRPDNLALYVLSKFWFVAAILLYYPVFYVVCRRNWISQGILIHAVGYLIFYLCIYLRQPSVFVDVAEFSAFKLYPYFSGMMIGAWIRNHQFQLDGKMTLCRCAVFVLIGLLVWGGEFSVLLY